MTLRSPPHITHVHIRLCTETSLSIHTHAPAGRLVCNDLNSAANVDDDHCAYPGCTSSERIDYDPIATIDDGLCVPPVPGCTCSLSANYDPEYTVDDGSCSLPGCTDPTAANFRSTATFDDGTCEAVAGGGARRELEAVEGLELESVEGFELEVVEGLELEAPVEGLELEATSDVQSSPERQARRRASIAACMDPRAYSYDERAQVHIQDECLYFEIGCTDKDAINFQSWATSSGPHALCVSCLWLHLPSSSQLQPQSQPPHDRSLLVAVHGVHRQAGEQLRQAGDDWRPEPVHVRHRGLCRPDRQQLRAARHRLDRVRLFDHRLHGYHRTQLYLRRHRARQVHVPSPRLHLC